MPPIKITDPETIMYDRAQSKGYMEFGISYDLGHKCTCGHEFTLTVHEFWYETNPKNKMYDYIVIDKVCPKCRSKEIIITEDVVEARNRAKLERKAELEAERAAKDEKRAETIERPEIEVAETEVVEEEKPNRKRKRGDVTAAPGTLPPKKRGGKR